MSSNNSKEVMHVVSTAEHNELVTAAFIARGFNTEEARAAAEIAAVATTHGNRTHNALKALHLDELLGSAIGNCTPGAELIKLENRFTAAEVWDGNKKLGQLVAKEAFNRAIELADKHGIGMVSVDNAWHYLWGSGYAIDAANRGYIAYTNCTSTLAEVVPFGGKFPTLGTNPHTWAFPTTNELGFPICIDWATSTVAMGRVQQLKREGGTLPPESAVDADGNVTTDPAKAVSLLPFGRHKGYGLSLVNELVAAYIGGSIPTIRGTQASNPEEKTTSSFFFQIIHPEAMSGNAFAAGRNQKENVKAVIDDILGHGNQQCLLPGQLEAEAAERTQQAGGLLFSTAELEELNKIATSLNRPALPNIPYNP
ncbi:Ldh family oxidoreductase [Rubritalea spongiae]|uniref:Ldh family oxidoreductase n=1 Tax=Rubritalea spongiae TaxID=430797 RepID=A0ABW5E3I2_9BACT